MGLATAYMKSQSITLDGDRAFEELYTRLARWADEAAKRMAQADLAAGEALIEKSVSLLGFMDRCVDVSGDYETARRVLSLHRFAIGTLVHAKAERDVTALSELPQVFVSLAEIFAAIRSTHQQGGEPGEDKS